MEISKLSKPFPREFISWRVGSTNKEKTSAIALAYIDARDVMERLDEVCGPHNWQALYPHANGKTSCKIGINIESDPDVEPTWVWKENGAGDSDVEADKGAFSDAFKRAGVLWGIGRYLYNVPNIWVDIVPYGKSYKIKNPNDPKLSRALEQAEKGIRLVESVDEPAQEQEKTKSAPVSGEEFLLLQASIREADTVEALAAARMKVAAAKERLTADQVKTLAKERDKKNAFFANVPLAAE